MFMASPRCGRGRSDGALVGAPSVFRSAKAWAIATVVTLAYSSAAVSEVRKAGALNPCWHERRQRRWFGGHGGRTRWTTGWNGCGLEVQGLLEGFNVGNSWAEDGTSVGRLVGEMVGNAFGFRDGVNVGDKLGAMEGSSVGANVGGAQE